MADNAIHRLNYRFSSNEDAAGQLESYYVPYTLDMGLSTANTVFFSIPPSEDMTDGASTYMKLVFNVTKADGMPIEGPDFAKMAGTTEQPILPLALCNGAFGNFWSQINVSLNGFPLPPVTEASYTAFLVDVMGSGWAYRRNFLEPASGLTNYIEFQSKITADTFLGTPTASQRLATSNDVELYGRITSDFLMTSSQLIPDNVRIDISLARQNSNFLLAAPFMNHDLRLNLKEATLFVKRVRLNPAARTLVNNSLATRGFLRYQRLDCKAMPVPKAKSYRWPNVWHTSDLPSRIFFGLVKSLSYHGSVKHQPMFFETANMHSVRVAVNGREILPETIKPQLEYLSGALVEQVDVAKSQVLGPLMAMHRALDLITNRDSAIGITQQDWMRGYAIYAVDLPNYGSNKTNPGTVDIMMEFKKAPTVDLMAIAMSESIQNIQVSGPERTFCPAG